MEAEEALIFLENVWANCDDFQTTHVDNVENDNTASQNIHHPIVTQKDTLFDGISDVSNKSTSSLADRYLWKQNGVAGRINQMPRDDRVRRANAKRSGVTFEPRRDLGGFRLHYRCVQKECPAKMVREFESIGAHHSSQTVKVPHNHPPPSRKEMQKRKNRIIRHRKKCVDCRNGPERICRKPNRPKLTDSESK